MAQNTAQIAGIILAAGLASRMGRCKPLLPTPDASALETAVSRMRAAAVSTIIVVTGRHGELVSREAIRLGCDVAHNDRYESGMFSSVVTGVRALPPSVGAFFLLPADIPLVKTSTYASLIENFRGGCDVAHPVFMGERVHPPLISRRLAEPLLGWRGDGGLRGFLASFPHSALDERVADRGASLDMDAPEDYERLLGYTAREFYPDRDECGELLKIAGTPEAVIRHCEAVEGVAGAIVGALARRGAAVEWAPLSSACLLHDVAKAGFDHAARGAKWLEERGYTRVASLVASHSELPDKRDVEAEILYLADKLTDGTLVTTLDDRMERAEFRWRLDGEALQSARRRIGEAREIQRKLESATGLPMREILEGMI
jgi:probable phosphoglycerate mutase